MVRDWFSVTVEALQSLWQAFLNFIPTLIGAIIVFLIGWIVSIGVGKLVAGILKHLKFNRLFEKIGWKTALEKAEVRVDASEFVGAIFKWVLIIVFLMIAVEILGLTQFADFLKSILGFLPNVIIATLIFVAAVIIADIVEKIIRTTVEGIKVSYAHLTGIIVKWAIWIFAILAILTQLGIAPELLQILFGGLVAMLAISLGLAFGLGGKEAASELIEWLRKKLKG